MNTKLVAVAAICAAFAAPSAIAQDKAPPPAEKEQAAGHKYQHEPAEKVVTTAWGSTVAEPEEVGESIFIDCNHLKSQ